MDKLLFGIGFCGLVFFLAAHFFYLIYRQGRSKLVGQIHMISAGARPDDSLETSGGRLIAVLRLFRFRLSPSGGLGGRFLFPHTLQQLETLLESAGLSGKMASSDFLGLKMMLAAGGMLAGILAFFAGFPFAEFGLVLLPVAGYMLPVIWLNRFIRKRHETLSLAVPDFMDVLGITLQAGISFEQAFHQAAGIFYGPLREEAYRLHRELELGVDRETAWKRMLERNPVPELQTIANIVLQGTSLGVSMSEVFRLQAEDIRRLRVEHCKQKAAKASPKITLVTTLVMAPAVFIMILGLLLLNVFYNPQGLGIDGFFN